MVRTDKQLREPSGRSRDTNNNKTASVKEKREIHRTRANKSINKKPETNSAQHLCDPLSSYQAFVFVFAWNKKNCFGLGKSFVSFKL